MKRHGSKRGWPKSNSWRESTVSSFPTARSKRRSLVRRLRAPLRARGFVGVAFRLQDDMKTYDAFYLRPTNGRVDDQERRNHAAQYISHPQWTWQRLRQETPSKYESYVDLAPGEWTKITIEVHGNKARLYVHENAQPRLIVQRCEVGSAETRRDSVVGGAGDRRALSQSAGRAVAKLANRSRRAGGLASMNQGRTRPRHPAVTSAALNGAAIAPKALIVARTGRGTRCRRSACPPRR